jgi:archaetidylinositol phosphate synthase
LVLTRFRQSIKPYVDRLGRGCASLIPDPDVWTAFGAIFAVLSALAFFFAKPFFGGVFILASGLMDVIDGAVARTAGKVSLRGAFMDSNLDRLAEVFIYAGIAGSGTVVPILPILALAFSLLVSYARARAEGLGLKAEGVGIGERAERLIVLSVASILGFVGGGVLLVLALAAVTYVQRLSAYSSQLKP